METQQSVTEWAVATFGDDGSDLRCATRANEEMAELLSCLSRPEPDMSAVAAELADVCIVLWRLGTRLETCLPVTTVAVLPHELQVRWWAFSANAHLASALLRLANFDVAMVRTDLIGAFQAINVTAQHLGIDLQAAIDAKMDVNRNKRVWKLDGSGHGYHVKEQV